MSSRGEAGSIPIYWGATSEIVELPEQQQVELSEKVQEALWKGQSEGSEQASKDARKGSKNSSKKGGKDPGKGGKDPGKNPGKDPGKSSSRNSERLSTFLDSIELDPDYEQELKVSIWRARFPQNFKARFVHMDLLGGFMRLLWEPYDGISYVRLDKSV